MLGNMLGKYVVRVRLTNGAVGYLMDIKDNFFMISNNTEGAARFMTEGGAKSYLDKCSRLYNFVYRNAYISRYSIQKLSSF